MIDDIKIREVNNDVFDYLILFCLECFFVCLVLLGFFLLVSLFFGFLKLVVLVCLRVVLLFVLVLGFEGDDWLGFGLIDWSIFNFFWVFLIVFFFWLLFLVLMMVDVLLLLFVGDIDWEFGLELFWLVVLIRLKIKFFIVISCL